MKFKYRTIIHGVGYVLSGNYPLSNVLKWAIEDNAKKIIKEYDYPSVKSEVLWENQWHHDD
jgi:hypothetical protein